MSLALIGWIFVSPSVVLGPFFHKVNLSVDKWPISASNITVRDWPYYVQLDYIKMYRITKDFVFAELGIPVR